MSRPLDITVMFGGPSEEREVSLESGQAVAAALRSCGHTVRELDPQHGGWKLTPSTEVVFLALHGTYGEDGQIQKRLEELQVRYTGSDPESSRLAFDKDAAKERFRRAGIRTPMSWLAEPSDDAPPEGCSFPAVLKPIRQGSSVGLQFLECAEDWKNAVPLVRRFNQGMLVEERISGRETTVGILEDRALPIVEIVPKSGTFDYGSKYTSGATDYHCPAEFDESMTQQIQSIATQAFVAVGGRDFARVDIMVDTHGTPFVLEVNTLPGMTSGSLLPKAAAAAGIDFPELCERMVGLALKHSRS